MKTPIAIINNNPLNIRYSPMNSWKGQSGNRRGFCQFDTLKSGLRAALVLLSNYQRKGYDTPAEIVSRWAPATENNTKAYIRNVAAGLAVDWYDDFDSADVNTAAGAYIVSHRQLADLAFQMARVEIGYQWCLAHPHITNEIRKMLVDMSVDDNTKLPYLIVDTNRLV